MRGSSESWIPRTVSVHFHGEPLLFLPPSLGIPDRQRSTGVPLQLVQWVTPCRFSLTAFLVLLEVLMERRMTWHNATSEDFPYLDALNCWLGYVAKQQISTIVLDKDSDGNLLW